jgi:hypothetical protein
VEGDTRHDTTDEPQDDAQDALATPTVRATLGERLDAQARRRALALEPRPLWVRPFTALAHHVAELGDVMGERFERVELPASPDPESLGTPIAANAIRGRAPSRPAMTARGHTGLRRSGPAGPTGPSSDPDPGGRRAGSGRGAYGVPGEQQHTLPTAARSRLRAIAGPASDMMRIHDGPASDAVARAAGADAVTIGQDVHLRQGRYAPHRDDGLALIAHEATHVAAALDPGPGWSRATGADEEERRARHFERVVLGAVGTAGTVGTAPPAPHRPSTHLSGPAGTVGGRMAGAESRGARTPSDAVRPATTPGLAPGARAAATDRDLGPTAAAPDLESLRRTVVADVMRQLRTDYERGG